MLPAEFDRDPTGIGELLGIKRYGRLLRGALSKQSHTYVEDLREFELAPFESVEYKYRLAAGQSMVFAWQAQSLDGELTEVVYDLHSEEEGTDPEDS
ncbi:MAG: hypothetical protein CM15mP120_18130 [Pseudomonadota bacterium]|nr:MAG: hypothetical protein CM15mP120_18130 [Pseudomonadota bacterium]